jgi:hypothetical protein
MIRRAVCVGVALATVAGPGPAIAQNAAPPRFTWSADVRIGYYSLQRTERTGLTTDRPDFRGRLRLGAGARIAGPLEARARVAARLSTEQESTTFHLRDHAPTVDGLRFGEATLDEAYLHYRPSARWSVRAGRMQTKFALADLQGKSLDRGDSPNTDVTWTDGAHVTYGAAGGWRSHLIVQHNAPEGPTNVLRSPLAFDLSRSRLTLFAAVENTTQWGPVVQRGLDVTYIPGALRIDGEGAATRGEVADYTAIVARGSLAWPLGRGHGRFSIGGELGYAPNTPSRQSLRIGDEASGRAGSTGVQIGLTLADAIPAHRFGVVYGRTEAGWLIAPDFRNNDRLLEGRYQWAFQRNHSFEARLRHRQDLEPIVGAGRKRRDLDFYLRITSRF